MNGIEHIASRYSVSIGQMDSTMRAINQAGAGATVAWPACEETIDAAREAAFQRYFDAQCSVLDAFGAEIEAAERMAA